MYIPLIVMFTDNSTLPNRFSAVQVYMPRSSNFISLISKFLFLDCFCFVLYQAPIFRPCDHRLWEASGFTRNCDALFFSNYQRRRRLFNEEWQFLEGNNIIINELKKINESRLIVVDQEQSTNTGKLQYANFDFVFLGGRFCFPNGALQSNCCPKKEA